MTVSFRITSLLLLGAFLEGCSGNSTNSIEASGIIEGTDVTIASEVSGKILEVRVDEGSLVRPGDTLVLVDDTEYRLQLREAEANLLGVEAAYRLAQEGSRREDILQAEASFKTAEADYQRMKDLLAAQTVTQKQYDDVYARYVAAEQTYRKLKAGLRPEEVTAARARRDGALAQRELLRKKVHDCRILAPSPGTITLRAVEPGEFVMPGMNVARLTFLARVKLTIYVSETDLGKVRLGQRASVTIDSYAKGKTFNGTVTYISPSAEFTPKNVQTKEERSKLVYGVKIEVENPEGALKPGLPADARIETGGS